VSRTAAHGAGPDITPGIFRVSLNTGALDYARAAIAADRARRPTPQPEPEGGWLLGGLTLDEELQQMLFDNYRGAIEVLCDAEEEAHLMIRNHVMFARAAVARWGHPTPQPVAVSERLPGAKDCALWLDGPEVTPWCWAGKDIDGGWEWAQISMLGLGADTLSRIIAGGGWTHWLPANALPLPEAQP
jgi:hypothetical protein